MRVGDSVGARLLAALIAGVLAALVCATGALRTPELLLRDVVLRSELQRDARSVAVAVIDEESIRRGGSWPWSRRRLAALVDRIREAGAAGVVLDVLLPEASDGDEALAASLARLPSVIASSANDRAGWLLPAPLLREASQVAHVIFDLDRDGVVRGLLATRDLEDRSMVALSVAAARLLDSSIAVPVGGVIRPGFRAGRAIPTIGASSVLDGEIASSKLRGRVVFVGASAAGIGDRVVSPLSPRGSSEPGVFVQAAATEAVLRGDLLRPVAPLAAGAVTSIMVLAGLIAQRRFAATGGVLAVAAALLPLPLGAMLLPFFNLELPILSMLTGGVVVTGGLVLRSGIRLRRESSAAARRIRDLEALASALEEVRRDDAEARRVVAHELRTPLTSVRGLAQLLSDFDLPEDRRKKVAAMVVQESARLSEMVDALLDLERLKLREFGRVAVPVALSRLVEGRAAVLRAGTGRDIRFDVAPGLAILGDGVLLGRVVDNLVGNALKFAPDDQPVDVRLRAVPEGGAAIEVEDRGPGVPPEEREQIFQRFGRSVEAAALPGLGLGLAFVREVATWHGGSVELEAPPSGGSLFRVVLPLRVNPGAAGREP